ncbi:serine protease [Candidatus Falkowbacteria bacterium]|nr:serine protease [Candidatus Falkowbacteria bacterium]
MEKEKKKNNILLIIILAAIFGLVGGLAGELIVGTYILGGALNMPLFGDIDFSDVSYGGSNLIIRDAKKVVVEQNDKAVETINSAAGSLAAIFKKKSSGESKGSNSFNSDDYYAAGQEVGQGLIITSDGWIITSFKPETADNYMVMTKDKVIYAIDKMASDKLTSFNFLHVQAKDLPVKKFAGWDEIKNGQIVLAVNWDGRAVLNSIADRKKRAVDLVDSSDSFLSRISLAEDLSKEFAGSVLFNLAGDIVGLSDKEAVEPISHLDSAIKSLLGSGEVKRPTLGINYIDLSRLARITRTNSEAAVGLRQNEKGAIIHQNVNGVAVIKGSPAYSAGLKEGDIILSVNNIEINEDNNLTDIIQGFQAGDKINVIYSRKGEEKEVEVELGEAR